MSERVTEVSHPTNGVSWAIRIEPGPTVMLMLKAHIEGSVELVSVGAKFTRPNELLQLIGALTSASRLWDVTR